MICLIASILQVYLRIKNQRRKQGLGKSCRKPYLRPCRGCNLRHFDILGAQGRDVLLRETFIVLSQQPGGLCHFGFFEDIANIAAIAEICLPPCRLKNRGQLFLRLIVQVQALLLGGQRRNAAYAILKVAGVRLPAHLLRWRVAALWAGSLLFFIARS